VPQKPLIYELCEVPTSKALEALVPAGLSLRNEADTDLTRSYFDSFDWRLFHAGLVLELVEGAAGRRLVLRELGRGAILGAQHVDGTPRFAWDLPGGALGSRIRGPLDVRALLPQATVREMLQRFALQDTEGKTRLRLEVQRPHEVSAALRMQVLPVRGYAAVAKRALRDLARWPGLSAAREDPLVTVLALAGRRPGDYTRKPGVSVNADERADAAGRAILLELWDIAERNEEGVCLDLDSEFLHDYRVSVRRSRSFLSQVKGVFPEQRLNRFKRELAWLQEITGPCRDMDVYLLAFDGFKAALPVDARDDLDPFRGFLQRRKAREHGALVRAMASARYAQLKRDWRSFLAAPVPERSSLPNAERPVGEVAARRIRRVHRRVLEEGRAIRSTSPPDDLHELRKTCKKLRYLMELFRSAFDAEAVGRLIKDLKRLQDNLGAYQDLHIQEVSLSGFMADMEAEDGLAPATRAAMERLVAIMRDRQGQVRAAFAERFKAFDSEQVRGHFAAVYPKRAARGPRR